MAAISQPLARQQLQAAEQFTTGATLIPNSPQHSSKQSTAAPTLSKTRPGAALSPVGKSLWPTKASSPVTLSASSQTPCSFSCSRATGRINTANALNSETSTSPALSRMLLRDSRISQQANKTKLYGSLLKLRAERDDPTREWWLAQNHHITHRGHRLDFTRNPFQIAILQDKSREMVIRKSTQCGISECMFVWVMACVDRGLHILWAFPVDKTRNDFVRERVDTVIGASPYYTRLAKQAGDRTNRGKDASDAVTLKQLGRASVSIIVSNSSASWRSFSGDGILIDEVDQCHQGNMALGPDRYSDSEHQLDRRVGNPTIAGFGIDALYAESDRKQWHVKCDSCGDRQPLDWFQNVVREVDEGRYELRAEGGMLVCRRCSAPLDRHAQGEWVAENPRHEVSGYHVSQLFSGRVSIDRMWKAFNDGLRNQTKLQRFYNSVLGLPFSESGAKLTEALLNRCVGDYPRKSTGSGGFMGVDVGSLLHTTIIEGDNVTLIQALPGTGAFETLDNIMAAHKPKLCVIDAMPETRAARMFAERHSGRVLLCWFVDTKKPTEFEVDYVAQTVKCDRTQTLDNSHAAILNQQIGLPRDASSIPDFYPQMCAPTRVFEKRNENDPGRFAWREGSQADHYRHSINYAFLAKSITDTHGLRVVTL